MIDNISQYNSYCILTSSRILTVVCLVCAALSLGLSANSADAKPSAPGETPKAAEKKTEPVVDEATARKNFESDYDAGIGAVTEKNWTVAKQKFASALKALGDYPHPRKSTAQIMLNKAERLLIKDDAMFTAEELIKLKQWVEAEEAFRKVVDVFGETDTLRKKILACRAGMEEDHPDLKKAGELLKEKKWNDAIEAFNKVSDKLGGIRMIREGISSAQLGIEGDELLRKGPEYLKNKRWDDAFSAYKRLSQILGNTEEVLKGINAAQAGYAEERNKLPPAPALNP